MLGKKKKQQPAFLGMYWCLQRLALVTSCCHGVGQPCDEYSHNVLEGHMTIYASIAS